VVGDPVRVRYAPGPERDLVIAIRSDATTARDVREKMRATMQTAGKYGYREKEKFQRKMKHVLSDIDTQIARLQVRGKHASKDRLWKDSATRSSGQVIGCACKSPCVFHASSETR
jgi:hypothetical protein